MTIWFTARGAGLAALVLFTVATCLGVLATRHGTVARRSVPASRRYVVQYVHRATAGLGLVLLAIHLTTILADPYAGVGWRGALLPFTSGYRPAWVAFGSIAAYLFVGVSLLGLARGRMARSPLGARVWRGLHALAYAGWAAAMAHGFLSGSDSSAGWVRGLYIACLVSVLGAVAFRVVPLGTARRAAAGHPRPDRFAVPPAPALPTRLSATVPEGAER